MKRYILFCFASLFLMVSSISLRAAEPKESDVELSLLADLPAEIKLIIAQELKRSKNIQIAAKNIKNLRLVSKDLKEIIDNNIKSIIRVLAKHFNQDEILVATYLGTPAAHAWLTNAVKKSKKMQKRGSLLLNNLKVGLDVPGIQRQEAIDFLQKAGISIQIPKKALLMNVQSKNMAGIKKVIDAGVSVNDGPNNSSASLRYALEKFDEIKLNIIKIREHLSGITKHPHLVGQQPIIEADFQQWKEIIQLLLDNGAEPDQKSLQLLNKFKQVFEYKPAKQKTKTKK